MSKRLKSISIATKTFIYKPIPKTDKDKKLKKVYPELFKEFEAISIGDNNGTVCLVPLDECDRETAEEIVRILRKEVEK